LQKSQETESSPPPTQAFLPKKSEIKPKITKSEKPICYNEGRRAISITKALAWKDFTK
jgi:hypothetical protein